jgi:hypothetical protein
VNQVLYKVGGDGAIAFYDAMAVESKQKMAEYQHTYDKLEYTRLATDFQSEMYKESVKLKMNNTTGQGYMESVTSLHDQLSQKYLQMASNDAVRNAMQQNMLVSKKEYANSGFRDEMAMAQGYTENQTYITTEKLKNLVINNPDNYESLQGTFMASVSAMRATMPAIEYEKFARVKAQELKY